MLWAIASHFNACGYRSRTRNFRQFSAELKVPLAAVELSFDGRFELRSADADVLVQLHGGDVMWQKERLLNLALEQLPASCDAVAWLDGDLIFERKDWAEAARRALEEHAFIQPFSNMVDATPAGRLASGADAPGRSSIAAQGGDLPADYFLRRGGSQRHRLAPGKAWVGRREILDRHGFYDRFVIGTGDRLMLNAMLGQIEPTAKAYAMNPAQDAHYRAWAEPFHRDCGGPVGFVAGRLHHLWHGAEPDRQYSDRHAAFRQFGFDPKRDVRVTDEGVLAWNSDRPEMHAWVRAYFEARREDGPQPPA